LGSMIGDAAGGPIEFKTRPERRGLPHGIREWAADERVTDGELDALESSFELLPYRGIRDGAEPYGQWRKEAPAGTVTDDTRFKIILMRALHRAHEEGGFPIDSTDIARAFLRFIDDPRIRADHELAALNEEWLREFLMAARWELGERDTAVALPPERLWGGIPTVSGQMMFPPLAALYPGEPEAAYRAAYALSFIDNGSAKDLNASIISGLSVALGGADWEAVKRGMVETDPYRYGEIPWLKRTGTYWLGFAERVAQEADRRPARLFRLLEEGLGATTYWEAHVPFACMFAVLEFCDYRLLAAMQLLLAFGHDTDSNAQLLGAFVGAIHGPEAFPEESRKQVAERLESDYGEDVGEWVDLLVSIRRRWGVTGFAKQGSLVF